MLSTIKEESNEIDEVIFMVKTNDINGHNVAYYNGICSIFSLQSPTLKKLIRKHKKQNKIEEQKKKGIYLKHMASESFCFIRNTFYDLNPLLTYEQVVDILYSSIKYEIKLLIKQCNTFLMNINDINDYFIVIKSFSVYPKALFESFFMDNFTSKSKFIDNNIQQIMSDERLITYSSLFQIQMFCGYIISKKLINNQQTYGIITKWCKYQFDNKFKPLLCIKDNESQYNINSDTLSTPSALNTSHISLMSFDCNNDYMITKWQDLFDDFIDIIDLRQIDIEFLLLDVRSDHIMSNQDLLSILLQKYEYDKQHKHTITEMKNQKIKTKISQKSPLRSNSHKNNIQNNNKLTTHERRVSSVSTMSNLSSLSNCSGLSVSTHTITNHDTFRTEDVLLKVDEIKALTNNSKIDLRDNFGRYLKAEMVENKENKNMVKMHYIGWNSMWDKWIDIQSDYHLIANLGSITDREIQKVQLQDLSIGDKVIIKLPYYHKHNKFGWMNAEIINMDKGQLNVKYKLNGGEGHQNDTYEYWVHADNIDECR